MADAFAAELVIVATGHATHPSDVVLDDAGDPVLDEHGEPVRKDRS